MKIKSIHGDILFESEKETIKETLIEAVNEGANLKGAYLEDAYLRGANLRGAYLRAAYLRGANLRGADLIGADLEDAYLRAADLRGANLRGANLRDAYLIGADLRGAEIPMYSKWLFSFKNDKLRIGCKTKTIEGWDKFFESNEEFETPRDTQEFRQIHAMYLAYKTYYEFLNK